MVLFEIDAGGVFAVEFEGDAPRSIDVDSIARRIETPKRVEVETGQIHVLGSFSGCEAIKPDKNAFVHPGVDPGGLSLLKEIGKRLAPERPNHTHL
jgi:hypothetical protein